MFRRPSFVLSHQSSASVTRSLPFTPIRLFSAVDTDFCVPTVLNNFTVRESGWHRHYLWGIPYPQLITMIYGPNPSSVVRKNRSRTDFDWRWMTDDGWRTRCEWSFIFFIRAILTEADDCWLKRTTDGLTDRCEWGIIFTRNYPLLSFTIL